MRSREHTEEMMQARLLYRPLRPERLHLHGVVWGIWWLVGSGLVVLARRSGR